MKAGRPLATTSIAHPTDISLPVGKLSWDQGHDENRKARNSFYEHTWLNWYLVFVS